MTARTKFQELKRIDLGRGCFALASVKEYKRQRESIYDIKYVAIDAALEARLKEFLITRINNARSFEEYKFDCTEPEGGLLRTIRSNETDFTRIMAILARLNPENDKIETVDELIKTKAYMVVCRIDAAITVIGYKTIPENWKMKRTKGLHHVFFRDQRFTDLETEDVFSISNTFDFLHYEGFLYILSKKGFEYAMNFRKGMLEKAQQWYDEVATLNLFNNLEVLKEKVTNNEHYLRKIATIKNLGYYRNEGFMQRLEEVNGHKNWGIHFDNGKVVFSEETLDAILSILQNKRLHSELTEEDFDVEGVKRIES